MKKVALIGIIAFALVAFLIGGIQSTNKAAVAAPFAAPTPVSASMAPQVGRPVPFINNSTVFTADTATTLVVRTGDFEKLDMQYIIDQGTANSTTLTLRYSNNGVNWVNGPAIASGIVADGTDLQQYHAFGQYMTLNVNVTNANPVTITAIAVGK